MIRSYDPSADVPLVVILGAGASRGAADYWGEELLPPLTVDLFDERLYGDLLSQYDLAHQAGRYIAEERDRDDALGLEQMLHQLRNSEFEHHRRMAYAVPPYLQHLLYAVSEAHYMHAHRYDALIERLLRLPFVCFLTLNYDLMLDRRLAAHYPLKEFDDYLGVDKNWALIKLHGSVNWFYELPDQVEFRTQPPEVRDEHLRCRRPTTPFDNLRNTGRHSNRYPALALPEGPDDRLVLPTRHLWWLGQKLDSAPELDILVIGYSGLDTEILKLIRNSQSKIRHMTIVNRSPEATAEVRDRFLKAGIEPVWTELADRGFGGWVSDGGLENLVAQFGGPYPDAD